MKNVAILGATGAVGQELLRLLAERNFPVGNLKLLATARSAGMDIEWQGQTLRVEEATPESFAGVHVAFFAASNDISRQLAPEAVRRGCVVVDKSKAFRMDPDVPLAVPEVNPEALRRHKGIIASPNCSTIQLVIPLKAIAEAAGLSRVIVSTYQAVSGTGRDAMDELDEQMTLVGREHVDARSLEHKVYPHPIAMNLLPHCETFTDNGYTTEELKLTYETRKILDQPDLAISGTAVRVPVQISHAESVLVETQRKLSPAEAREALARWPGIVVQDDPSRNEYPTPLHAAGTDPVYVGRIREDISSPNGLWLWVVSDNLRKGAALNALHIAEFLLREGLI